MSDSMRPYLGEETYGLTAGQGAAVPAASPTVSVELTEAELSDLINARFRMLAYERGIDKLQAALDKLRGEQ